MFLLEGTCDDVRLLQSGGFSQLEALWQKPLNNPSLWKFSLCI